MGGGILFKCTVCSGRFTSKGGWLRHLFEPRHRDLARVDLIKKWRVEETRKCLIVVYSKGNVGKDEGIVQYFSKDIYKGIVGDFVWWEERPGIGFILFESRQTVKNLMKSLVQCNEISVDGQIFQVKVGQDFLDFEWDELLPLTVRAEIEPVLPLLDPGGDNQDKLNGACSIKKENEDSDLEIIEVASPASSAPVIILDSPQPQEEELIVDFEENEEYLSKLLSYISSEVQIPSRETSVIFHLLHRVKEVLTANNTEEKPDLLETKLIGNFSLCLKYHGEEYPSVFFSDLFPEKKKNRFQSSSNTLLHRKLLDSKEVYAKRNKKQYLIKFSLETPYSLGDALESEYFEKILAVHYKTEILTWPRIDFLLIGNAEMAVEAQMWLLAKYLISFHPICKSLMEIVYHWANINSVGVTFGSPDIPTDQKYHFEEACVVRAPLGLTWMVLFFLYSCEREEVFIPSPDVILQQNHKRKIYEKSPRMCIDLGFERGLKFRQKFKADFHQKGKEYSALERLQLAYGFFSFWARLAEDSWVIDLKYGKFYRTEELLLVKKGETSEDDKMKMELDELVKFMQGQRKKQIGSPRKGIYYMGSPFSAKLNIPICDDALVPFVKAKGKMEQFLKGLNKRGGAIDWKGEVQAMFKI